MSTFTPLDRQMMRRAITLAQAGSGHVSPNPMVGAVITDSRGRIIGEGWHRRYGQAHAEVNAVASVSDPSLLQGATVYVTLEPCSHYGKTPPCAKMLCEKGVGRVVVAVADPNPKVSGRGMGMLRGAGITVDCGLLAGEAFELNLPFFTAHTLGRPYVTLKWAEGCDGSIDGHFSIPETAAIVHRRRARADAIIVGAGTVIADNPRLDTRLTAGPSPVPVVLDRHKRLNPNEFILFQNPHTINITDGRPLQKILSELYTEKGFISVLVEGGASVLKEFIAAGLWDEAYVERSHAPGVGKVTAPVMPTIPNNAQRFGDNIIYGYSNMLNRVKPPELF